MLIVALDGSGDFSSIQQAIDSILDESIVHIFIKSGIYQEKLILEKSNVALIGEDHRKTIITFNDYAHKLLNDQTKAQTFRSYTAFIHGNHLTFENLTFENCAGKGCDVGQALAAYVDGDCIHFKNCRFLGHQDTLFTGPLPPSPIILGSFIGPLEQAKRLVGRHYYENCFIQGDIDFIFGGATAYFENCTLYSNQLNGVSYITAASTPKEEEYGYVFQSCHLIGDANESSVYLGRPWREYAHVAFLNCYLDTHIHPKGWHDWNKEQAHFSIKFVEFQNSGPSSSFKNRASFSKELSLEEADVYRKEKVLKDWKPY